MLKKLLEERGINLTKAEFGVVMEIVTDDIKFNRISFKKMYKLKLCVGYCNKKCKYF